MDEEKKVSKGAEKIIRMISELEPQEFLGVCKILGVRLYDGVAPISEESVSEESMTARTTTDEENKEQVDVVARPAELLFEDVFMKVVQLNRIQRRNLTRLLKAATKKK